MEDKIRIRTRTKAEINPGTPDHLVCKMRLRGRMHARDHAAEDYFGRDTFLLYGIRKNEAQEWWLGWTDERYKRFFGRK